MESDPDYKTYIVRVWQVQRDEGPRLFVSVDDCRTGAKRVLASPDALPDFLRAAAGREVRDVAAHPQPECRASSMSAAG